MILSRGSLFFLSLPPIHPIPPFFSWIIIKRLEGLLLLLTSTKCNQIERALFYLYYILDFLPSPPFSVDATKKKNDISSGHHPALPTKKKGETEWRPWVNIWWYSSSSFSLILLSWTSYLICNKSKKNCKADGQKSKVIFCFVFVSMLNFIKAFPRPAAQYKHSWVRENRWLCPPHWWMCNIITQSQKIVCPSLSYEQRRGGVKRKNR